ncbi:MAG TPA: ATP-binding protein [Flavisolibacter sp.]|jgi:signal transduction histidine kinase|nr:ATP-binding protein [Flavisolibacter sp.]
MILIVDDRQENVFSLRTVLEQYGFRTDAALSGEEALKKVLKQEYALIILDVQMPVMDGFEVAEALTGMNKTKDIPIIFLSAVNTHKRFITKGFESGAVDYLTKPVDPDILMLKVRNFYRLYEKNSALKEAEKELTATVNELHSTLESLPQLAFTANRDGELQFVNKQWFLFSGAKDRFPETGPGSASLRDRWLQSIQNETAIEMEVSIKKLEDGQFYHHLLRATPVYVNESISRWVGTLTSIHEQKLLNETLERKVAERTKELLAINRELEISNDELQQFTSVASHDLKEPLRKIQFFGSLIMDGGVLDEKMTVYMDKIIRSSKRMSQLISDLLSFARLSEELAFEEADLNEIISDILFDLELGIKEKGAVVSVQPIPLLEVVPSLMRQLFQNLISNALKFSKPGVAPQIRIWAEQEGQTACRIAIADNGIGFEEKYKDKIFTLFQRLHAREAYEGTGIGLTIAKKIVEKHNGTISVNSQPGEGTTFLITLPLHQADNRLHAHHSSVYKSHHT